MHDCAVKHVAYLPGHSGSPGDGLCCRIGYGSRHVDPPISPLDRPAALVLGRTVLRRLEPAEHHTRAAARMAREAAPRPMLNNRKQKT